jgi:hypothetical protein
VVSKLLVDAHLRNASCAVCVACALGDRLRGSDRLHQPDDGPERGSVEPVWEGSAHGIPVTF